MVRADHPYNVKRGGAYVRESLPVCNSRNSYLSKCLTLEVTISNKKGYVITSLLRYYFVTTLLHRSPSQTSYEF